MRACQRNKPIDFELENAESASVGRPLKQGGFALLTVLLVVALVSIIAAQMMYQQSLEIQRTTNRLNQAQSNAVVQGLANWIKKGLKLDAELNQTDHLAEEWAKPMPPIPFAGGEVSGYLSDWQGRLNVNNLQQTDKDKLAYWQGVFQRFFRQQGIESDLTAVIKDWVDGDNEFTPGGAESDAYLLKQPAYRAANQKLVLPMEMGLLQGVTPEILTLLQPNLATLPSLESSLNVNTMTVPVMMALADWMTQEIATTWEALRLQSPAQQVGDFRDFLGQQTGFTAEEINQAIPEAYFSVKSDYFLLQGLVSFGASQQAVSALFYRQDKTRVDLIQKWYTSLDES